MKKGKRASTKKINKKRLDRISYILEELDKVALALVKWSLENKETINKEKIKWLAESMTDLPIGDLEVSLLWSKINDFQDKLNEYRRKQKEEADNL
ncbi:MAG: hypothetical protein ACSLE0_23285 [Chitinophagaceae bacterium]